MHEFDLIERLQQRCRAGAGVETGIGDDTAVLKPATAETRTLVTVDLIAEGTHFTIPPATPREIGHKALGVNLSDIAAMAGQPEAAFVAVALPRRLGAEFADELFEGIRVLADEYGVSVAGGDTNIWDGPLVVSITLTGRPTGRGPVLRSGARPGDWLMVTGSLGGSFGARHLACTPRVREALALHAAVDLHAMIDLSDGLSRDVRHITVEQGTGAIIDAAHVPIHRDVDSSLSAEERLQQALNDGEDFELLFAVSPQDGARLLAEPPFDTPLTHVGMVTDDSQGVLLRREDGTLQPLKTLGFEHRFA